MSHHLILSQNSSSISDQTSGVVSPTSLSRMYIEHGELVCAGQDSFTHFPILPPSPVERGVTAWRLERKPSSALQQRPFHWCRRNVTGSRILPTISKTIETIETRARLRRSQKHQGETSMSAELGQRLTHQLSDHIRAANVSNRDSENHDRKTATEKQRPTHNSDQVSRRLERMPAQRHENARTAT